MSPHPGSVSNQSSTYHKCNSGYEIDLKKRVDHKVQEPKPVLEIVPETKQLGGVGNLEVDRHRKCRLQRLGDVGLGGEMKTRGRTRLGNGNRNRERKPDLVAIYSSNDLAVNDGCLGGFGGVLMVRRGCGWRWCNGVAVVVLVCGSRQQSGREMKGVWPDLVAICSCDDLAVNDGGLADLVASRW
ncbi:unnamed protein product [Fraxinus pennsylvanica]|uniref:Uncharacterized protein n=1 Tax=Fraxinus pennsylvanica TaxID=56036 RepID=A0AAD2EAK2_9LAMI|nr:unnamed protein product [Fraxinus pennsylvanica]